jgi:hypothetical protein
MRGPPRQLPGEVAQLVEHTTENRGVVGSIPTLAIPGMPGGSGFPLASLLFAGSLFAALWSLVSQTCPKPRLSSPDGDAGKLAREPC